MTHPHPGHEHAQPAYPPGPYASGPYGAVRSFGALTPLALVAAGFLAFFGAVQALAFFVFIEDYREAVDAGVRAWDVFTWGDLASIPMFGALVFAYICSCLWLQRARSNVLALGSDPSAHARSAVWVWLGWWVPIVSFWFPYQVVRDVWNESQAPARKTIGLGWWWATWLVGLFAHRAADRLSTDRTSPLTDGRVDAMAFFYALFAVMAAIGVFLWARIVVGITRAQRERAARQGIMLG